MNTSKRFISWRYTSTIKKFGAKQWNHNILKLTTLQVRKIFRQIHSYVVKYFKFDLDHMYLIKLIFR